jgi:prepilin-type N-terminal cleavage/methylation domain-containing protein
MCEGKCRQSHPPLTDAKPINLLMKTNKQPLHSLRQGFTLVELLIVISIIAVLAGVSVPAIGGVMKKAKREQTRILCLNMVSSLKNYQVEYSKFPSIGGGSEVAPVPADEIMVGALLGQDKTLNRRGIRFLPDMKQVEGDGASNGLLMNGVSGSVVDFQGQPLQILMDIDNDGKITNPDTSSSTGATDIFQSVLVYSGGDDKSIESWNDNITSWSTKKAKSQQ